MAVSSLSLIGCGWFDDSETPSDKSSAKVANPVKADPSVSSRITVAKGKLDSANAKLDEVHKDLEEFQKVVGDPPPAPAPKDSTDTDSNKK